MTINELTLNLTLKNMTTNGIHVNLSANRRLTVTAPEGMTGGELKKHLHKIYVQIAAHYLTSEDSQSFEDSFYSISHNSSGLHFNTSAK